MYLEYKCISIFYLTEQSLREESNVLNELGFNEEDFNAVEDDIDDPDEEVLDEQDEDDQEPNESKDKTETNNTDDENKKRSLLKKPVRTPKTCEKCHKTYNTQTQFRIHQRVRE